MFENVVTKLVEDFVVYLEVVDLKRNQYLKENAHKNVNVATWNRVKVVTSILHISEALKEDDDYYNRKNL